jgi:hypothetical protein
MLSLLLMPSPEVRRAVLMPPPRMRSAVLSPLAVL